MEREASTGCLALTGGGIELRTTSGPSNLDASRACRGRLVSGAEAVLLVLRQKAVCSGFEGPEHVNRVVGVCA